MASQYSFYGKPNDGHCTFDVKHIGDRPVLCYACRDEGVVEDLFSETTIAQVKANKHVTAVALCSKGFIALGCEGEIAVFVRRVSTGEGNLSDASGRSPSRGILELDWERVATLPTRGLVTGLTWSELGELVSGSDVATIWSPDYSAEAEGAALRWTIAWERSLGYGIKQLSFNPSDAFLALLGDDQSFLTLWFRHRRGASRIHPHDEGVSSYDDILVKHPDTVLSFEWMPTNLKHGDVFEQSVVIMTSCVDGVNRIWCTYPGCRWPVKFHLAVTVDVNAYAVNDMPSPLVTCHWLPTNILETLKVRVSNQLRVARATLMESRFSNFQKDLESTLRKLRDVSQGAPELIYTVMNDGGFVIWEVQGLNAQSDWSAKASNFMSIPNLFQGNVYLPLCGNVRLYLEEETEESFSDISLIMKDFLTGDMWKYSLEMNRILFGRPPERVGLGKVWTGLPASEHMGSLDQASRLCKLIPHPDRDLILCTTTGCAQVYRMVLKASKVASHQTLQPLLSLRCESQESAFAWVPGENLLLMLQRLQAILFRFENRELKTFMCLRLPRLDETAVVNMTARKLSESQLTVACLVAAGHIVAFRLQILKNGKLSVEQTSRSAGPCYGKPGVFFLPSQKEETCSIMTFRGDEVSTLHLNQDLDSPRLLTLGSSFRLPGSPECVAMSVDLVAFHSMQDARRVHVLKILPWNISLKSHSVLDLGVPTTCFSLQWLEAAWGMKVLLVACETDIRVYVWTRKQPKASLDEPMTIQYHWKQIVTREWNRPHSGHRSACFLSRDGLLVAEQGTLHCYLGGLVGSQFFDRVAKDITYSPCIGDAAASLSAGLPEYHPSALYQNLLWGNREYAKAVLAHVLRSLETATCDIVNGSETREIPALPLCQTLHSEDAGFKPSANESNGILDFSSDMNGTWTSLLPADYRSLAGLIERSVLSSINSYETCQLIALVYACSETLEMTGSQDENGFRYMISLRFRDSLSKQLPEFPRLSVLKTHEVLFAFFSDSQETLVEAANRAMGGSMRWEDARKIGLGYWLRKPELLKTQVEHLARNTFNYNGERDPTTVTLFYVAMGMRSMLHKLWRVASHHKEAPLMRKFLANDFSDGRWKRAALKNAFVLLGKQRHEYAAGFFLLGDSLEGCVNVLTRNLDDLQLAMVVCTLYEGENGPVQRKLIQDRILTDSARDVDEATKVMLKYRIGNQKGAVQLLEETLHHDQQSARPAMWLIYRGLLKNARAHNLNHSWFALRSSLQIYNRLAREYDEFGLPSLGSHVLLQFDLENWTTEPGQAAAAGEQTTGPGRSSHGESSQGSLQCATSGQIGDLDGESSGLARAEAFEWGFGEATTLRNTAVAPSAEGDVGSLPEWVSGPLGSRVVANARGEEVAANCLSQQEEEAHLIAAQEIRRSISLSLTSQLVSMVYSWENMRSDLRRSEFFQKYAKELEYSCDEIPRLPGVAQSDVREALLNYVVHTERAYVAIMLASVNALRWPTIDPLIYAAIESQIAETQTLVFSQQEFNEEAKRAIIMHIRRVIWAYTTTSHVTGAMRLFLFRGARLATLLYMFAVVRWYDYDRMAEVFDEASAISDPKCTGGEDAARLATSFQDKIRWRHEPEARETDIFTRAGIKSLSDSSLDYMIAAFLSERYTPLLRVPELRRDDYNFSLLKLLRAVSGDTKRLRRRLRECWNGEPVDGIKDWVTSSSRRVLWERLEAWATERHILREVLREDPQSPFLRIGDSDQQRKPVSGKEPTFSGYEVPEPTTIFKTDTAIYGFCINNTDKNHIAVACNRMILELDVEAARVYLKIRDSDAHDHGRPKAVTAHNPEYLDVALPYRSPERSLSTLSRSSSADGTPRIQSAENLRQKFKRAMHQFPKSRSDHASLTQLEVDDGVRQRYPVNASCLQSHPHFPFFVCGYDEVSRGNSLTLWQFGYTRPLMQYSYEGSKLVRVHFDSKGERFGALEFHGELNLFLFDSFSHISHPFDVINCHPRHAFDFAFLNSSSLLTTVGTDHDHLCHMSFWDTLVHPRSSRVANVLLRDVSQHMVYVPRHHSIIVGNRKGELEVHDIRQQSFVTTITAHTGIVSSLAIDDEADILYSGSVHGDVKAWNLKTLEEVHVWNRLHEPKGFISSIFDRMPMGASGTVHMAPTDYGILCASADGLVTSVYRPRSGPGLG